MSSRPVRRPSSARVRRALREIAALWRKPEPDLLATKRSGEDAEQREDSTPAGAPLLKRRRA